MKRRSFLAGALALAATSPRAHQWYDPFCCNGKDCRRAPEGSVRAVRGGYAVALDPGQHPMVTVPLRVVVPYAEAKPSGDGDYHICVFPADTLRCLYVPPGGV